MQQQGQVPVAVMLGHEDWLFSANNPKCPIRLWQRPSLSTGFRWVTASSCGRDACHQSGDASRADAYTQTHQIYKLSSLLHTTPIKSYLLTVVCAEILPRCPPLKRDWFAVPIQCYLVRYFDRAYAVLPLV